MIAGVVGSQVDGDHLSGYNKLGLHFGALVNRQLGEKISGQLEMLYVQKGSRTPIDSTGTLPYYRMRLQYVEVPVLLNYHFGYKKYRGLLEAGLSYATLVKAVEETAFFAPYKGQGFEKNDVSVIGGLGFRLGKLFVLHFRYSRSVMPIRTGTLPGPRTFFSLGQYNNLLLFSMRIYFKPLEP